MPQEAIHMTKNTSFIQSDEISEEPPYTYKTKHCQHPETLQTSAIQVKLQIKHLQTNLTFIQPLKMIKKFCFQHLATHSLTIQPQTIAFNSQIFQNTTGLFILPISFQHFYPRRPHKIKHISGFMQTNEN